jgi:hypothetical protein
MFLSAAWTPPAQGELSCPRCPLQNFRTSLSTHEHCSRYVFNPHYWCLTISIPVQEFYQTRPAPVPASPKHIVNKNLFLSFHLLSTNTLMCIDPLQSNTLTLRINLYIEKHEYSPLDSLNAKPSLLPHRHRSHTSSAPCFLLPLLSNELYT